MALSQTSLQDFSTKGGDTVTRKTETEPMLRGHAKHRRTQSDYMGALLD